MKKYRLIKNPTSSSKKKKFQKNSKIFLDLFGEMDKYKVVQN